MKILFISPSNSIGGAEISLKETIIYLEKRGIKCYVLIHKTPENVLGNIIENFASKVFYHKIPSFSASHNSRNILNEILSQSLILESFCEI